MLTSIQRKLLNRYLEVRFSTETYSDDFQRLAEYELGFISFEELQSDYEAKNLFVLYSIPVNRLLTTKLPETVPLYINNDGKTVLGYYDDAPLNAEGFICKQMSLYSYIKLYQDFYGSLPKFLLSPPPKYVFEGIIQRAISLNASDIQISCKAGEVICRLYAKGKWNAYPTLLDERSFYKVLEAITLTRPYNQNAAEPADFAIDINEDYRGRVNIVKSYKGHVITVRLTPTALFDYSFNDLNFSETAIKFFDEIIADEEPGLRLFIGATNSGKSTTILALLSKILSIRGESNIISIELPVEQELRGITQVDVNSGEGYKLASQALIRQNPDYVYISEINAYSSSTVIKTANTAKAVFSTMHANSAADAIYRISDLTGMTLPRIISSVHSIIEQKLKWEHGKCYPVLKIVRFDEELKMSLLNGDIYNIYKVIKEKEVSDEASKKHN